MKRIAVLPAVVAVSAVCCGMLNTINCPDCGNIVSVRAFMCPKCGCSHDAIDQHVRAVDALSRLPPDKQRLYTNGSYFGQAGRVKWLQDERAVRNVLTNEVAALASYKPAQKKAAQEASAQVRAILALGFTMNQVFVLRHDLVCDILGKTGHMPTED